MGVDFGDSISQLAEAIKELSQQLKDLSSMTEPFQQVSREESERLERYKTSGALLEFTLVTGGLIQGSIEWVGDQSIWIRTGSGQDMILYKHAIAFIQEQEE